MPFLFSILFIIPCLNLVLTQTCHDTTYNEIMEGIKGIDKCTYPTHKFTARCIANSCLKLTIQTLCPTTGNGDLNQNNVEKTIQIINDCLKQKSICGVPMNPIPSPSFNIRIDQYLQGTPFTGRCTILPHNVFVHNVNGTTVSLVFANVTTKSLLISTNVPNLSYDGKMNCHLESNILSSMFGRNFGVSIDDIVLHVPIDITVDKWYYLNGLSDQPYSDNQFIKISTSPEFSPFDQNPILKYLGVQNVFTYFVNKFIEISSLPNDYGNFISAIVKSAFEVTKQHCE